VIRRLPLRDYTAKATALPPLILLPTEVQGRAALRTETAQEAGRWKGRQARGDKMNWSRWPSL
jgi:hypothetical protein